MDSGGRARRSARAVLGLRDLGAPGGRCPTSHIARSYAGKPVGHGNCLRARWWSAKPCAKAASDFKGHEIRHGYALSKNINVMARLYLVDAITTAQDGKRFRFDLNWKF